MGQRFSGLEVEQITFRVRPEGGAKRRGEAVSEAERSGVEEKYK